MTPNQHLDVTTKAAVLLEALPYIQRFRNAIFVVKYGGAFMDDADPMVRIRVATDIAFLHAAGIKVVVVHGGGKAITRALAESGIQTQFEQGLRVTDAKSVKIVEHTLNRVVSLEICEILQSRNAPAMSIPGNDVLVCNKKQVFVNGTRIDLGFVGETHTVRTQVLQRTLSEGYIPVISPIARDRDGQVYNTNADAAAARVAVALQSRRLVYLCDVPGLMKDVNQPDRPIPSLSTEEVEARIKDGTISQGMIPKTESAVQALKRGVHRVHFIHGQQPHSLLLEIFTDKGVGTEIVNG